jgi:phospholipid/cholesterol/gamma-HCH transport system substrate-binding protein
MVFFGGLALLLWATQELSDITFGERQVLTVEFDNARGLRVGEPVFVLGTQLGKVATVEIKSKQVPDQDELRFVILAHIQLDSEVRLKADTEIKVVDSSMLGGKRVDITPGRTGEVIDPKDHVFIGTAPLGPLESLGKLIGGPNNKANLEGALAGIRQFMDTVNKGEGSLARFISDDTLIRDAEAFVASIRKSAEELERKQGLLGRLIYDAELGRRADAILADIEQVTQKLNGTEGTLGKLINDTELAAKVDKIVDDATKVSTNLTGTETTLGRLINDKELGRKVDDIVANLEKTTDNLNDKDAGLMGALLHDEAMLADGRKIIRDLSEISDKINTGKGALARLINDDDMGRRLDSMIRQITRAIEDAREAAPVGTFFQVFSSAF